MAEPVQPVAGDWRLRADNAMLACRLVLERRTRHVLAVDNLGATVMTPLPETIELGTVGLAVGDLDRSLRFYTGTLGMVVHERAAARARLGTAVRPLLELEERRGGVRAPEAAGLFHVAWRVPDRAGLGAVLRHLHGRGARLAGASDHDVSEALYLEDPDGHGIEIYHDRPREAWYRDGRLTMGTRPMDVAAVLAAAEAIGPRGLAEGTVIGHVHLETHDLPASRRFYEATLGLEVMAERPGAVFLAKAGYHHHVAVNAWGRRSRPQDLTGDALGLLFYTIAGAGRADRLVDPAGVEIRLTA